MRCLDSTFLIDLLRGDSDAVGNMKAFEQSEERLAIAAPSLTEVLVGAHFKGGRTLSTTLDFLSRLEVLEVDREAAADAGRLGSELLRRGEAFATVDLIIAATARLNQCILVTRDAGFSRVPGLAVETY